VENRVEPRKTECRSSQPEARRSISRSATGTFVAFFNYYTPTFALGVKTGNWHVFPIDNPVVRRKIAIAGARALSFPPRLMRGNRQ
jgi:hypothetical protein